MAHHAGRYGNPLVFAGQIHRFAGGHPAQQGNFRQRPGHHVEGVQIGSPDRAIVLGNQIVDVGH